MPAITPLPSAPFLSSIDIPAFGVALMAGIRLIAAPFILDDVEVALGDGSADAVCVVCSELFVLDKLVEVSLVDVSLAELVSIRTELVSLLTELVVSFLPLQRLGDGVSTTEGSSVVICDALVADGPVDVPTQVPHAPMLTVTTSTVGIGMGRVPLVSQLLAPADVAL